MGAVFRAVGLRRVTGRPRGLSKWVISRVISALSGVTPNYDPTYNRLTKSPGPPSIP